MTVGQAKRKLNEFDERLELGGVGHFGEILEIDFMYLSIDGFVALDIESAGEEPY